MSGKLTSYRVFIASPSGLETIRKTFKEALHLYNETDANERQAHFIPVGWEETLGGIGRPQERINQDLAECDYFILVLHDRWGSPPSNIGEIKYSSGTEEEFHTALNCFKSTMAPMKDMVLFFKTVDPRQLSDPGVQLERVLTFRKEREAKKDFLYHTFDSEKSFEDFLIRHLAKWVRDHESNNSDHRSSFHQAPSPLKTISSSVFDGRKRSSEDDLANVLELVDQNRYVEAEMGFSMLIVKERNSEVLSHYARYLRKTGQLDKALEVAKESSSIASERKQLDALAFSTHQTGRILEGQGKLVEAAEAYRRAIALFEIISDPKGEAAACRNLGKVLKKRGELEDALHELEKSRRLYEESGDESGAAGVLGYLGVILKSQGYFSEAEKMHRQALEIHKRLNNNTAMGIVYGNLGTVARLQGRIEEGLELHQKSLDIHKKNQDIKGICRELSNIGVSYRHLGKLDESIHYHSDALRLAEQIGDTHGVAIQHGSIAQVHLIKGDFDEAERLHLKSLTISKEIKDNQGIAIQLKNLGTVYRRSNNLDKAEEVLHQALEIDTRRGFTFGVAKTKFEIGKCLALRKNLTEANQMWTEALSLFLKSSAKAEIHETRELIELAKGDHEEEFIIALKN